MREKKKLFIYLQKKYKRGHEKIMFQSEELFLLAWRNSLYIAKKPHACNNLLFANNQQYDTFLL